MIGECHAYVQKFPKDHEEFIVCEAKDGHLTYVTSFEHYLDALTYCKGNPYVILEELK